MARQITAERFPEEVYSRGMKVHHDHQGRAGSGVQQPAQRRDGLRPAPRLSRCRVLPGHEGNQIRSGRAIDEALQDIPDAGDLMPALILAADGKQIKAYRKGGEVVTLTGDAMKFAAKMLDDKAPPNKRLKRGAIIRLYKDDKGGKSASCRKSNRRLLLLTPRTAPFGPWSAASISTATSSTT
jgi:penicillin-binding protein 1A